MPLNFQAPDWLIKEYMDRQSPGQQVLNSGLKMAELYAQQKALGQKRQDEQIGTYLKAGEIAGPAYAEQVANRIGLQNPPLFPGTTRATTPATAGVAADPMNPSPAVVPPTPEGLFGNQEMLHPGAPEPGAHVIDHWNQTMAGQQDPTSQPTAEAPAVPSQAELREQNLNKILGGARPEDLAQQGKWGAGMLDRGEKYAKFLDAKAASTPASVKQFKALREGKDEDLQEAFPNGIPANFVGPALNATSRNIRVTNDQYGNPIRVPVAGGEATPVVIPKDNWNPIQKKLNPNEYKQFQSEVNDFDKDDTVKNNRLMLNNMSKVESMVDGYNPSLTGPIASQQARAIAGEVGALTDSDIVRQSLDPSLIGRLKKFVSVAITGELPQDQLNLLKDSLREIRSGAQSRVVEVAQERAGRMSRNFGGRVSAEELMGSMNLPTHFSNKQQRAAKPALSPQEQAEFDELHKRFGGKP